jgi:hypothetical protein
MRTSDSISEIGGALAKAQAEMANAKKDSQNPHFRSSYADLASVRDACLPALTKHGIAVVQSPRLVLNGQAVLELDTRLVHGSGQWIEDTLGVPLSKVDAQGVGSATTYARRYALAAFAGIAPADDDGEAAVGRSAKAETVTAPKGYEAFRDELGRTAEKGETELRKKWSASPTDLRAFMTSHDAVAWEEIKAAAKLATEQAKTAVAS